MPCRYDPSPAEIEDDFNRRALAKYKPELDRLTALLCEACRWLDESEQSMPRAVRAWWDDHQKKDAARRAEIRAAVLARLTTEERAAFEGDK